MNRFAITVILLSGIVGCSGSPLPTLAGGKPVGHWIHTVKSDPDPKARKEAAFKLGNVGATDPEACPALVGALQDRDAHVRCEAIIALVKFGEKGQQAVPRLAELRKSDRDSKVRAYAAKALEKLQETSNLESASVK